MVPGGHAWCWEGVCGGGGRHGARGACMVPGGACVVLGGMHGAGRTCVVAGGPCMGYDEIRSMSGRYASYWNAFLFVFILGEKNLNKHMLKF